MYEGPGVGIPAAAGTEQPRINLVQQPPDAKARRQAAHQQRAFPSASLPEAVASAGYDMLALETVKELSLAGLAVRMELWSELPLLLQQMPRLLVLDLSRNALGLDWAAMLAVGLEHTRLLRTLRLNGCSIIDLGTPLGLPGPPARSAFEEALQATPSLRHLQLAGNHLSPGTAVALASALRRVGDLEELALQQNRLGPDGARMLLPLLQWTPALKELQLGRNSIGPEGIAALAEAVPRLPDLEVLGLECNDLGPEGAMLLAKIVAKHRALVSLDVSWNDMGMDGLKALSKPLHMHSQLSQVRMGGNGIDPAAEREMAQSLRRAKSPAIGVL